MMWWVGYVLNTIVFAYFVKVNAFTNLLMKSKKIRQINSEKDEFEGGRENKTAEG